MAETQASGFPICKKGTKTVVGVITRNDLLRKPDENQLGMLMVRDPVIVSPDADIKKAVDLMLEKGFRRIPVVKSGELVGVISIPDILGCILEEEEEYQTATIADYVNRTVVSVWEQTPLILSYMIMEMAGKNAIIIVDDTGRLAGMISVSDYIRLSEVSVEDNVSKTYSGTEHSVEWGWTSKDYLMVTKKLLRLPDIPVREAMTKNIISVSEVSTISDCVKILRKNEIDEAPVISAAGLLTGIIEDRELLKLAAKRIAPVQKTER